MKKEEVVKLLTKIELVKYWCNDMTGSEYIPSNQRAQELIEKLEEVE